MAAALKGISWQTSQQEARQALRKAVELLGSMCSAAAAIVQEAEEEVLVHMSFPDKHWRQIHSTNPQLPAREEA